MSRFVKERRLCKRREFKTVMESGKKHVSSCLVSLASPNSNQARLGLVVSKRVGNAVVRNKVKRRLREIFRARCENLPNLDLVMIARHESAQASFDTIARDFDYCLRNVQRKVEAP